MTVNITASTPGAMVLLLSTLFSSYSLSGETTLNCSGPDRPVITDTPLVWPHIKQKVPLTQSCWVSLKQAKEWQEQDNAIWVDVRSTQKKQALFLEGALDIPLTALFHSHILRHNHIVMVGDGFDQPELDKACLQLREAGFEHVYALQGGIQAQMQLSDEITPEELLFGVRAAPWTLITWDIRHQDIQKLPEKPAEQWFSAEGNLSLLSQRINAHANAKSHKETAAKIVVITADNETNQDLKSLLQRQGAITNVLWLQGGLQAYQNYIQQQHSIQMNTGLSLQRSCNGNAPAQQHNNQVKVK